MINPKQIQTATPRRLVSIILKNGCLLIMPDRRLVSWGRRKECSTWRDKTCVSTRKRNAGLQNSDITHVLISVRKLETAHIKSQLIAKRWHPIWQSQQVHDYYIITAYDWTTLQSRRLLHSSLTPGGARELDSNGLWSGSSLVSPWDLLLSWAVGNAMCIFICMLQGCFCLWGGW